MAECKVDDIICQLEMLQALKTIGRNMSKEAFLAKYPQLAGLQEQLANDIETTQRELKSSINACGNLDTSELPEGILEEIE